MKDIDPNMHEQQLNQVAKEKHEALDKANKFQMFGTAMRSGFLAITGYLATAFSMASIVSAHNAKNPKIQEMNSEFAKMIADKGYTFKAAREFKAAYTAETLKDAGSVVKTIANHSGKIALGVSAVGAGLGLYWQNRVNTHNREKAQQEVNEIEKAQRSWAEKTAERGVREIG